MASEMVQKVMEAEKTAQQIEQEARVQAQEILSLAQGKAAAILTGQETLAKEQAERILSDARSQAQTVFSQADEAAKSQILSLRGHVANKRAHAVNVAVNAILAQ